MTKPLLSASVDVTVQFHDCDPMGVVWHGHYFKYFEVARCALLQRFDYDYPQMHDSGFFWPLIDAQVRYIGTARYGDVVTVQADLNEWENRLRIDYVIRQRDSGKRLTKGHSIQVAVAISNGEMQLASPSVLLQKLEPWLCVR